MVDLTLLEYFSAEVLYVRANGNFDAFIRDVDCCSFPNCIILRICKQLFDFSSKLYPSNENFWINFYKNADLKGWSRMREKTGLLNRFQRWTDVFATEAQLIVLNIQEWPFGATFWYVFFRVVPKNSIYCKQRNTAGLGII